MGEGPEFSVQRSRYRKRGRNCEMVTRVECAKLITTVGEVGMVEGLMKVSTVGDCRAGNSVHRLGDLEDNADP